MSQIADFGPLMIDLAGLTLTDVEKDKIQHPNTGAVILFARNYQEPEQVTDLIRHIRSVRDSGLLIAVDQEGGRVQRFREQFTRLPSAAFYANQAQGPELACECGWLMATELISVGLDFSFAPVLDVDSGISEIIGDRSFSKQALTAAEFAGHFRQGMRNAGMAAVGKHFPGHGAVAADSHLALPVDERDFDSIKLKDLLPFKALIEQGLEGIMPAHVIYSQVDPLPAGFSPFWIQEILRKSLGFDGAVFSDDLSMEGAAYVGDYQQRVKTALSAGCDMALVCNNPEAAEQVLDCLPIRRSSERNAHLRAMLAQNAYPRQELLQSAQWQARAATLNRLLEQTA